MAGGLRVGGSFEVDGYVGARRRLVVLKWGLHHAILAGTVQFGVSILVASPCPQPVVVLGVTDLKVV